MQNLLWVWAFGLFVACWGVFCLSVGFLQEGCSRPAAFFLHLLEHTAQLVAAV